jgi:phosphatidylglycerophosphate synthase
MGKDSQMKLFLLPDHQEIIFEHVFGNPVFIQVLRFYHKVNGCLDFTLVLPPNLIQHVTVALTSDPVLKNTAVKIEEATPNQLIQDSNDAQHVPLNRVYYDRDHFVEVTSVQSLNDLRNCLVRGIRARSSTPVARHINKRVSLILSQGMARWGVLPNVVTVLAIVFSVLGGLCLFSPRLFWLGFVFFQINSLLDGCDGEVAWMNVEFSAFGKKLDIYGDYLTTVIIIVCEGLGLSLITGHLWVAVVAGFSIMTLVCVGFIWFYAVVQGLVQDNLAEVEGRCHATLKNPKNFWDKIHALFLFVSRRDFYILTLFVLACFQLFFVIHIFILVCTIAWLMLSLYTLALLRRG